MTFWVAGAVVAGGVIGAVGANQAAGQQAGAANQATAVQQQMFNQTVANEQPYMSSGAGANSYLNYLLGVPGYQYAGTGASGQPTTVQQQMPGTGPPVGGSGPTSYMGNAPNGQPYPGGRLQVGADPNAGKTAAQIANSVPGTTYMQPGSAGAPAPTPGTAPGASAGGYGSLLSPFTIDTFHNLSPSYQFDKQQGMQGVLNGDASGQGALSGAAQKDLIGFNSGLANDQFTNAFNMYQTQQGNIYQRLAGIAQQGQAAASNSATGASAFAGGIGQTISNAGTARAGGTVGAANSLGGAVSSLPWLLKGAGAATPASSGGGW